MTSSSRIAAAPTSRRNRFGPSTALGGGFTLLEVLLAILIISALIVGLTQGGRFALSVMNYQAQQIETGADLDSVHRLLQHLIEHARPASEAEPLMFVGGAHAVAFTSVVPLPQGGRRDLRADVALNVDAAHRLNLVWTRHVHAIRTVPPPPAVVTQILPGVARIDLRYWPGQPGSGWTSVWRDEMPPRLLGIRIIFADAGRPAWPELVVSPKLDPP
ncbi:MAG TPA: hypothetical protein VE690_10645 [Rhodopila sp.]|nr:hypothetical protein [Rhodopila sp.]